MRTSCTDFGFFCVIIKYSENPNFIHQPGFVPWELVLLLKYVIFETKAALSKFKKIEENMIKIIYFAIKHDTIVKQTICFFPPHMDTFSFIITHTYTNISPNINHTNIGISK